MRARLRLVILVATVLVPPGAASCLFDPAIPDDALILCTSDADCPDDKTCNLGSQICARQDGSDGVAPGVNEVTIARDGSRYTVVLDVTEALFRAPDLVVADGADLVALTLDAESSSNTEKRWTFTYDITGDEAEGNAALLATLVDVSGNAAQALSVGTLLFDFTPPSIVDASFFLVPEAGNPLASPTSVAPGTSAVITIRLDEPAAAAPLPELVSTPEVPFTLVEQDAFTLSFAGAPVGIADGPITLELRVADLAGNTAALPVIFTPAGLVFDATPPDAPSVDTPDLITYTRAPWGAKTGPQPLWKVSGGAGAVPPDAVAVRITSLGVELARGAVDPDGSFSLEVPGGDRPRVRIASIDGAGNRGPARDVRDIELFVSINQKVPGSLLENPHVLEAVPALGETLEGSGRRELGAEDGVAAGDGRDAALGGTSSWRRIAPGFEAPAGSSVAVGFSRALGAVVAWDTFERRGFAFTGDTWRDVLTNEQPTPRGGAAFAYDSARNRLLLVGGEDASGRLDEVWELDANTGWSLRVPATPLTPGPRSESHLAFDEDRGVAVLFGGRPEVAGGPGETWEWDGTSWTLASAQDTDPPTREGASMRWMRGIGIVLVGGIGPGGEDCEAGLACTGTWIYDGAAWNNLVDAPAAVVHAGLAHDHDRHILVLTGGEDPVSRVKSDDVWEFDGASWTLVDPAMAPGPRSRHSMVEDHEAGGVLVVAGNNDTNSLQDTWRWDGTSWERVFAIAEVDLEPALVVEDPAAGVLSVGLRGGVTETWRRDDGRWSQLVGTQLPARGEGAIAADLTRGVIVVHGGDDGTLHNDTFELVGADWVQVLADGIPGAPPPRKATTMAYSSTLSALVLFSGLDDTDTFLDDAWRYDGAWTPLAGARPGPRFDAAMADDPAIGLVLFGGIDEAVGNVDDTWVLDAAGWRRIDVVDDDGDGEPAGRHRHALAYAPDLGGVVLHGGKGNDGVNLDDGPWLFTGTSWRNLGHTDVHADGELPACRDCTLAGDQQTGELVAHADGRQFVLEGADARPALVFHVNGAAALAHPGSVTTEIFPRVYSGGDSAAGPGAELLLWDGEAWQPIGATNTNPSTDTSSAIESPVDDTLLPRAFVGRDESLHLAVVPRGPNSDGRAKVAVEALDVIWRYREP